MECPAIEEWRSQCIFSLKNSYKTGPTCQNHFRALEIDQKQTTVWDAFSHKKKPADLWVRTVEIWYSCLGLPPFLMSWQSNSTSGGLAMKTAALIPGTIDLVWSRGQKTNSVANRECLWLSYPEDVGHTFEQRPWKWESHNWLEAAFMPRGGPRRPRGNKG